MPYWTPYVGLGLPLAAEAQPAAFFLPFVLLLHAPSGVVMLKLIMQVLAGLSTFAALRELGNGRAAASIAGGAYALNGTFAWFSHSMILPIAFLPTLVFGLERSRRLAAQRLPGGELWIAIGLAYSLLAGFPETAFMDGLLAGLWALTALLRVPKDRRWALLGKITLGGCCGLALSAPAWLCFLELLPHASIGAHVFVALNHLTPGQAPTLLFPTLYGAPYTHGYRPEWSDAGGYFGAGIACLALVSLCGGPRLRELRWALAGWVTFWLAAFFGEPLSHAIWAGTPVLNQVQMTRYAMPSMEFAAVVLAALAIDEWRRGQLPMPRVWGGTALMGLLACAVLSLGAGAGRLNWGEPLSILFAGGSLVEAAVVLCTITWCLGGLPTKGRAVALAAVVLLSAGLQFTVPELAGELPRQQALGAANYLRGHAGLTRVFSVNNQVPVNYSALLGFASIQADLVPAPLAWTYAADRIGGEIDMSVAGLGMFTTATDQVNALRASVTRLEAADVGYIVTASSPAPFAADPLPGMALAYDDGHSRIYTLPHSPYTELRGGPCQLSVKSRLRQTTDCVTPATLVRRELWLAGWQAWINGQKTAIVANNGIFQSVALPPGHADVVWRYRPPHSRTMILLSAFGAITIMLAALRAATAEPHC